MNMQIRTPGPVMYWKLIKGYRLGPGLLTERHVFAMTKPMYEVCQTQTITRSSGKLPRPTPPTAAMHGSCDQVTLE